MSPLTRDRLALTAAYGLFLLGLVGWWRTPYLRIAVPHETAPMLAIWLTGIVLALATAWFVEHRHAGVPSPLVGALTLAVVAPLCVVPWLMAASVRPQGQVGLVVASLAVLPLAFALCGWITRPPTARRARWFVVMAVAGAVLVSALLISGATGDGYFSRSIHDTNAWTLRWLLASSATLVPAGAAAASALRDPDRPLGDSARALVAGGLGLAGILPVVTGVALITTGWSFLVVPVAVALATGAVLGLVAIRPLARQADRAVVQRDLVIAAADAERTRLAYALHDGPLGDVALLVQRLDAAGDADNAALARTIASDLRTVGNDLRLPLVEDLGLGPALEWLVQRLSVKAEASIHLEVRDVERPPAEVELCVYQIAQEALVNAVTHGGQPVDVRYTSSRGSLSLVVDDRGSGIDDEASARAQRDGRLGLIMMRRRADAIGARLAIAARSGGGTRVELSWGARGA